MPTMVRPSGAKNDIGAYEASVPTRSTPDGLHRVGQPIVQGTVDGRSHRRRRRGRRRVAAAARGQCGEPEGHGQQDRAGAVVRHVKDLSCAAENAEATSVQGAGRIHR